MKFKLTTCIFTLVAICLLNGCQNTIQGFGKDMQHAGQKIENSNQSTKQSAS